MARCLCLHTTFFRVAFLPRKVMLTSIPRSKSSRSERLFQDQAPTCSNRMQVMCSVRFWSGDCESGTNELNTDLTNELLCFGSSERDARSERTSFSMVGGENTHLRRALSLEITHLLDFVSWARIFVCGCGCDCVSVFVYCLCQAWEEFIKCFATVRYCEPTNVRPRCVCILRCLCVLTDTHILI
jgi:hypothetical protein